MYKSSLKSLESIDSRLLHFAKADEPIAFTLFGIRIEERVLHSEKAKSPMEITLVEIVTDDKLKH